MRPGFALPSEQREHLGFRYWRLRSIEDFYIKKGELAQTHFPYVSRTSINEKNRAQSLSYGERHGNTCCESLKVRVVGSPESGKRMIDRGRRENVRRFPAQVRPSKLRPNRSSAC